MQTTYSPAPRVTCAACGQRLKRHSGDKRGSSACTARRHSDVRHCDAAQPVVGRSRPGESSGVSVAGSVLLHSQLPQMSEHGAFFSSDNVLATVVAIVVIMIWLGHQRHDA